MLLEHFLFTLGSSDAKTYHHINQTLSWESAKTYCRTHHTDLAMIENEEENQQVLSVVSSPVWIGLYRVPWTWSDGTNCSFRHWLSNEPDNNPNTQFCGVVHDGGFSDVICTPKRPFICSGKQLIKYWMHPFIINLILFLIFCLTFWQPTF